MSDKQAAPAAANDSAPAPADPGTPPKRSRLTKIVSIVAGVFAVFIIGIKVLGFFMLPACDSHAVTQTLKEIFAGKQVTVNVLNDIKALTDTNKEKVCQAHVETPDEKATVEYQVNWDGWSSIVKVNKVETL